MSGKVRLSPRPSSVGVKAVFEGFAERIVGPLGPEWHLRAKISHFVLHPTKGYRKMGLQKFENVVKDKPDGWIQGYQRSEIVKMGVNLPPIQWNFG